jgi:hypothetical protein
VELEGEDGLELGDSGMGTWRLLLEWFELLRSALVTRRRSACGLTFDQNFSAMQFDLEATALESAAVRMLGS